MRRFKLVLQKNGLKHLIVCLLVLLCVSDLSVGQKNRTNGKPLRGYTVMAGGLGRPPKDAEDMWSNTAKAHLSFIDRAKINLVVIEVPYGVSKKHPKSAQVMRFIKQLKKKKVEVWVIYPHVLAQTFDLPRQVGKDGKRVDWNCCFNRHETQNWLVENGKSIVKAYAPDGLLLFGLFHVGSTCTCEFCKKDKDVKPGTNMEKFFLRFSKELHGVKAKIKLGTTGFWSPPSRKTLGTIDMVSPVIAIFRPGYAKAGRVKTELSGLRSKYKGKPTVPYIKLFLASQTDSKTEDVLAAAREGLKYGNGFFFWGYNPGHQYLKQEYDHKKIEAALVDLAKKKSR